MSEELVPVELIENKIFLIRGLKVMLDRDLALLYGVDTASLNQAVKRNIERFPGDFMFSLTQQEKVNISQFVICSRTPYETIKHSKNINVFTEHGILMLSSVLNSERAVAVNIQIMRTFTKLRRMFFGYKELKELLEQMESKYDGQFKVIFDAINEMLAEQPTKIKGVGFKSNDRLKEK